MSGEVAGRSPIEYLFFGVIDFICLLLAAESLNALQYRRSVEWIVAGIASVLIGYYWPKLTQKFRKKTAKPPAVATEKPADEQKRPATQRQLFENDWPTLPSYCNDGGIEAHSTSDNKVVFSVKFSWRLNGDFVSRSTFLAFFMESTVPAVDALNACIAIADTYGQFIDEVNHGVDISGQSPDDTSATYVRDMVFSKRIFIYYENPDFSLAQKGAVEALYKSRGLSVQFRDAGYTWAHREDHPPFRPNPLTPKSILLPDARLHPGLTITARKLD
jgi:hypothetical protein